MAKTTICYVVCEGVSDTLNREKLKKGIRQKMGEMKNEDQRTRWIIGQMFSYDKKEGKKNHETIVCIHIMWMIYMYTHLFVL